jgi:hypothetical protein
VDLTERLFAPMNSSATGAGCGTKSGPTAQAAMGRAKPAKIAHRDRMVTE